ncbi:MAG: ATP-dependent DNA helicase [Corynebacterium sp.]|nr:ATP-dependent DNA helicase [Corynebacterium sp.]
MTATTNGTGTPIDRGDARDPKILATKYLGMKYAPNEQQAAVISAPCEPIRVIAGAGAGKTETMAARAVWLVINEGIRPEEILGLTFTRKAARELGRRIRERLSNPNILRNFPDLKDTLRVINPTVMTYDAYFARILREYGLLLPTDVDRRVISTAELLIILRNELYTSQTVMDLGYKRDKELVEHLRSLLSSMNSNYITSQDVKAETTSLMRHVEELIAASKRASKLPDFYEKQEVRLSLLKLIEEMFKLFEEQGITTFDIQTTEVCRLVDKTDEPGIGERAKYRAVMLDEYQDTSYAQHHILKSLFGGQQDHLAVTVVGDPMQAIYAWRGGDSNNLVNFGQDFLQTDGSPAATAELSVSWRNPDDVLELANFIVKNSETEDVVALDSRPGAGSGLVEAHVLPNKDLEIQEVVRFIKANYWEPNQKIEEDSDKLSAAVLVRANNQILPIATALQKEGISVQIPPVCVVDIPEVKLLHSVATVAADPSNDDALLAVLSHPRFHIGLSDLMALSKRLKQLTRKLQEDRPEESSSEDPADLLRSEIDQVLYEKSVARVGLGDALADLGAKDMYSEEGYRRLVEVRQMLRAIRKDSLSRPLPELFVDIENHLDLRTELLSNEDPLDEHNLGLSYLDEFYKLVENYSQVRGATLVNFLEYLDYARSTRDAVSTPSNVRSDCVQILTAHSAKGLEWDVVCVPFINVKNYSVERSDGTFITSPGRLPIANLRNVAAIAPLAVGYPKQSSKVQYVIDETGAFEDTVAASAMKTAMAHAFKQFEIREQLRLLYVAVTRSQQKLMVSSHIKDSKPLEIFTAYLDEYHPEVPHTEEAVLEGFEDTEEQNPMRPATWPRAYGDDLRKEYLEGAKLISETEAPAQRIDDNSLAAVWDREVTALIEEYERSQSNEIEYSLPNRISTSDLIAIQNDPADFARRIVRPVPLKPNRYAKQGTAFHTWVETQLKTGSGLWDAVDLDARAEIGEDPAEYGALDEKQLQKLKDQFLGSDWATQNANRTIRFVEQGYEIRVGNYLNKGRIDAIFHEGDDESKGWIVVDWKTGRKPTGAAKETAAIQLAAYRIATARFLTEYLGQEIKPEDVRALFYYVAYDSEFEPKKLMTEDELAALANLTIHDEQPLEADSEEPDMEE